MGRSVVALLGRTDPQRRPISEGSLAGHGATGQRPVERGTGGGPAVLDPVVVGEGVIGAESQDGGPRLAGHGASGDANSDARVAGGSIIEARG